MMKKKSNSEKARIARQEAVRRRRQYFREYFVGFTRYFLPWLHDLTKAYKEKGEFPVLPVWLLPSYYKDPLDKEVAAIASLLVKRDERMMEHITAIRSMLGNHPFEWFQSRQFVSLSVGSKQNYTTAGVSNLRWATLFDTMSGVSGNVDIEKIEQLKVPEDKKRFFLAILGVPDGFSHGTRYISPKKIKCPLTEDVMDLLKTFCPDYPVYEDKDGVIHLFGFDYDFDFFYAALAYKELQRRNPKGCSRLVTIFQRRYERGTFSEAKEWIGERKGILPKIEI